MSRAYTKTPPLKSEAVKKPSIRVLQKEKSAVLWQHEPRKSIHTAALDPFCKQAADELACGGRGEVDWRRPCGAGDLGVGGAFGIECVLPSRPEQRRTRRASGVRSAASDLFVGVCLQPGDRIGAGSGAAVRVRSCIPVADGAAGSELPQAGGFSRGKTKRIGR